MLRHLVDILEVLAGKEAEPTTFTAACFVTNAGLA